MKYPVFLMLAHLWVLGLLCGFTPVAFLFELLVLGMIILAVRHNPTRRALSRCAPPMPGGPDPTALERTPDESGQLKRREWLSWACRRLFVCKLAQDFIRIQEPWPRWSLGMSCSGEAP